MKFLGFYNLGATGTESFTGTDAGVVATANNRKITAPADAFFIGQFSNLSPIDIRLFLRSEYIGTASGLHVHDLRAYESIELRCIPLVSIGVALNGTALIHGMGILVVPESPEEKAVLLANAGILERLPSGRYYNFTIYDHADITTNTTTTIATPASGQRVRVYKIIIGTITAVRCELRWTDSDGTSNVRRIGQINFGGEGSFVIDLGDKGIECPNGNDGLLRVVTTNIGASPAVDVDVISTDVLDQ